MAAVQVLWELLCCEGHVLFPATKNDLQVAVAEKRWRQKFFDEAISKAKDNDGRSKAFNRARDGLIKVGFVGSSGDMVWVTSKYDPEHPDGTAGHRTPLKGCVRVCPSP